MASKLAAKLAASPGVDASVKKMKEIGYTSDTARGGRIDASETFLAISAYTDDTTSGDKVDAADGWHRAWFPRYRVAHLVVDKLLVDIKFKVPSKD